jgi:TPR repeat protein
MTIHAHPLASGRPWRAELLAQMNPQKVRVALEGEDPSEWLHAVMVSGMAEAQIRLGRLLLSGEGLPTDRRAALACFLSAAATGQPGSPEFAGPLP